MSIRLPLQTVLTQDSVDEVGAGSVAGGIGYEFTIPQDADNVVVKCTASTVGGGVSWIFQTTDDGGTTWYDVSRTSVVSNANSTTAEWLSIPVNGAGLRTTIAGSSSTVTGTTAVSVLGTIGTAAASALGMKQTTGLPILSQKNRMFLIIGAAVSATALAKVEVKVNSQSATA